MNYLKSNDYELLYYIHLKDEEALRILIRKYQPLIVYNMIQYFQFTVSAAHLEEIKQESQFCLWQAIYSYRFDKNTMFSTYFRHLLFSHYHNYQRKLKTDKGRRLQYTMSLDRMVCEKGSCLLDLLSNRQFEYEGSTYLRISSLKTIIANQLKYFTVIEKKVFALRIQGYSYDEIAKMLHIDKKRVEYVLSKVRKCRSSIDYELSLW